MQFRCRCSALGNITVGISFSPLGLTEKQSLRLAELQYKGSKSQELKDLIEKRDTIIEPTLSTGAKTYIQDVWYSEHFEFQKSFTNKFTEKGKIQESRSIKDLIGYFNSISEKKIFASKNEQWLQNDWIHGTPDLRLNTPRCTIDTKNVYYPNGLSFFDSEKEKRNYIDQIHGYNWLDGKDVGFVARILMNPPDSILEKEVWNYWKDAGKDGQPTDSFRDEVRELFNFERKPIDERVNLFRVATTENDIKVIKKAVELSNEYWKVLNEQFSNRNTAIEFFKNR